MLSSLNEGKGVDLTKDRTTEEPKLLDRLLDIVKSGMLAFGGLIVANAVPPLAKLFDGRHVYAAVMQEIFERRHVLKEKTTVLANRIAAQRRGLKLTVIGDLFDGFLLGIFD